MKGCENMKSYIIKEIKKNGGRTFKQLYKTLTIKNFITKELLWNSLYNLYKTNTLIKCYGNIYVLNKWN